MTRQQVSDVKALAFPPPEAIITQTISPFLLPPIFVKGTMPPAASDSGLPLLNPYTEAHRASAEADSNPILDTQPKPPEPFHSDSERYAKARHLAECGQSLETISETLEIPLDHLQALADMEEWTPRHPDERLDPTVRPLLTAGRPLAFVPLKVQTNQNAASRTLQEHDPMAAGSTMRTVSELQALREYIRSARDHDQSIGGNGGFDKDEIEQALGYTTLHGFKLANDLAARASLMLRDPMVAPEHLVMLTKVIDTIQGFRESIVAEQGNAAAANQGQGQGPLNSNLPVVLAPMLADPASLVADGIEYEETLVDD